MGLPFNEALRMEVSVAEPMCRFETEAQEAIDGSVLVAFNKRGNRDYRRLAHRL